MALPRKIRCGLHLRPNSHLNMAFPATVLIAHNSHPTFNNLLTSHPRNFASQEAILKCSQLYNIQACKALAKVIPHQEEGSIKPIQVHSNLCNLPRPDLSLALRAGHSSNRLVPAVRGVIWASLNDDEPQE